MSMLLRKLKSRIIPLIVLVFLVLAGATNGGLLQAQRLVPESFTNDLKLRTFQYFWEVVDTITWQNDDRYPDKRFTSIASTGFGLTSYLIGVENGFITRDQATERVLKVLSWLQESPQGKDAAGVSGYRGFYYHFLNYQTGTRYRQVELSTIDTGLLMAGILACQSYFDLENPGEQKIRQLADELFLRVEWDWAMNNQPVMSMGWHPEKGFIPSSWTGYNEAMILLIMAMGSPTHPIPGSSWDEWCRSYEWGEFYGYEMVNFSPLFGHQYSHIYIDFRGVQDPYMRSKGIDYFENSRRATLANRAYCIDNPGGFAGYGDNVWGLTACDGPANTTHKYKNTAIRFFTYRARGASLLEVIDDGTLSPTAAGGSIPFAPAECLKALFTMKQKFGDRLYQQYGFKDAFNLSYTFSEDTSNGWFDPDYIGIDQGPILIQLENHETELVWNLMKKNKYILSGLEKAGFKGGWLDDKIKRP